MTPRAVSPARARKCAAGLREACLAERFTFGADTECIPVTTSLAAGQTPVTCGTVNRCETVHNGQLGSHANRSRYPAQPRAACHRHRGSARLRAAAPAGAALVGAARVGRPPRGDLAEQPR